MIKYTVYELFCPISLKVKYIGVTKYDLDKRLKSHLLDRKSNLEKNKWIDCLKYFECKPIINSIIEFDNKKEAFSFESEYTNKLVNSGIVLINLYNNPLKLEKIEKYKPRKPNQL